MRRHPPFRLPGRLAFQIADDILDVTQTSEQLGKTAGKDVAAEKATYPALYGLEASQKKAQELVDKAGTQLEGFGARAACLQELAHFLVGERNKLLSRVRSATHPECVVILSEAKEPCICHHARDA